MCSPFYADLQAVSGFAMRLASYCIRSRSSLTFLVSAGFSPYPLLARSSLGRCAVGIGTYFRLPWLSLDSGCIISLILSDVY